MASKKSTRRRGRGGGGPARPRAAARARAWRLLASAQTVIGDTTQVPEPYAPSDPMSDGESAAGLIAYYATGDQLEASRAKAWPQWVTTLLERKLKARLRSVRDLRDRKWLERVATAREHVSAWQKVSKELRSREEKGKKTR